MSSEREGGREREGGGLKEEERGTAGRILETAGNTHSPPVCETASITRHITNPPQK